jgi:hypothetical protein
MIDFDTLPDMTPHMLRYRPTHVYLLTDDGMVSVMTFEQAVDFMVHDLIFDGDVNLNDPDDAVLMDHMYFHSVMDLTLELLVANGHDEAEQIIRTLM